MSDIERYCAIRITAKEMIADSSADEIERIKRKYYGLNGAGKGNFEAMQSKYEKLRDSNPERLKSADTDGCTYRSFTYALSSQLGGDTDPKIRRFKKKKQGKKSVNHIYGHARACLGRHVIL